MNESEQEIIDALITSNKGAMVAFEGISQSVASIRRALLEAKEELEKPKRGWHESPMLTCVCFACKAHAKVKEALELLGKAE